MTLVSAGRTVESRKEKKLQVESRKQAWGVGSDDSHSEEIPSSPPKEGALPTRPQHSMGTEVLEGLERSR